MRKNPDLFNQAIIEYGAMVVSPKSELHNLYFQLPVKHIKNKVLNFLKK